MTTMQQARSVTARRLAAAFVAVLLLFGAALVVELITLRRIGQAEDDVARLDHAKHAGHMAAAQVREQYIHQAHTLIEFDHSHLDHYQTAVDATRAAMAHLDALAGTDAERNLARAIAALAAASDRDFRQLVIPAVERGERGAVSALGARLESRVDEVVRLADQLNRSMEARADVARARAVRLREQSLQLTLGIFALAIVLAAIVGVWLTRSIMRPVAALRAGVRRVGDGDLGARIEIRGGGEFAELAGAFNEMTADLRRHQEALVRTQKLAAIGQVAAGVAHEINNPLGVILGYAKLLRPQLPKEQAEEVGIIESEAVQCQRIVQGLLDLARPQNLDLGPVDLAELAREAVGRLDETGAVDERSVRTPAGGAAPPVAGDEGKLRQVITNLVLNAAQATGAGGHIDVEVAPAADDQVALSVRDDGPGMPPEVRARIFDPFFTTKRGGTGLGLSIVQAIVDAHGGRIEVDSAPGGGTRVTVCLPKAAAQGAP
jgi:signal transduction histidine kinase